MSRTDKDKPYWVKQNDEILARKYGKRFHDHLEGHSEFLVEEEVVEKVAYPYWGYRPVVNLSDSETYYWIDGIGVVERYLVTERRRVVKRYAYWREVADCDSDSLHERPV
ncbi:hypothetical protein [Streptomyces sp. CoH17]|uniref:hypothetical protein n=1 Tax=Streptomyces sp. CoH17 TaxID=2992806 RepID=UPI00226E1F10|nr:hypothetical protein [Streptomyces sp. CoH17]